jgi:xanthine dehydrogenase YagS FAD-binding subunit
MKGTTVASARIVLGQVAPTPWVAAEAAKALAGKTVTAETAEEAAKAALAGATPLSHNAYKVQLARVAVKRALLEAARGRA